MLDSNQFKSDFTPTGVINNMLENAREEENYCFLKGYKFFHLISLLWKGRKILATNCEFLDLPC